MQDFRNLKVWTKAHQLVISVYRETKSFPSAELYGLTSQLRRAGTSIPSNIAEGCGRQGNRELVRFLNIAMGSANELEYQILLARELEFLKLVVYQSVNAEIVEVKRMLASLIRELRSVEGRRADNPRAFPSTRSDNKTGE